MYYKKLHRKLNQTSLKNRINHNTIIYHDSGEFITGKHGQQSIKDHFDLSHIDLLRLLDNKTIRGYHLAPKPFTSNTDKGTFTNFKKLHRAYNKHLTTRGVYFIHQSKLIFTDIFTATMLTNNTYNINTFNQPLANDYIYHKHDQLAKTYIDKHGNILKYINSAKLTLPVTQYIPTIAIKVDNMISHLMQHLKR